MVQIALLPDRGVVEVAGADRVAFLQGLVSNDVAAAAPGRAVWAALLTPQGKWLADFFILADADRLLLDCERGQAEFLVQRLGRYRLRSAVTLSDHSASLAVHVAWGGVPTLPDGAIAAPDPRLPEAGWRVLSHSPMAESAGPEDWDRHRLRLGLPDGSRDLEADRTVLLEAGFDELGGVSWSKGCYMGQELTARTKYRGLIKRRLVPVAIAGPIPKPGSPIVARGAEVGTMRSSRDELGLAVLRFDALTQPLECEQARLTPRLPAWLRLPEAAAPDRRDDRSDNRGDDRSDPGARLGEPVPGRYHAVAARWAASRLRRLARSASSDAGAHPGARRRAQPRADGAGRGWFQRHGGRCGRQCRGVSARAAGRSRCQRGTG